MINHHRKHRSSFRAQAFAKHLVENGNTVTLVTTADTRRWGIQTEVWDGVTTVTTPDLLWGRLRSGWDPWNVLNRTAWLLRDPGAYDLIHLFETRPGTIYPALAYLKTRRVRLPVFIDWIDWWGRGGLVEVNRPRWYKYTPFPWMEQFFEEHYRGLADGTTVISTALAGRAEGLGIPADTIHVVPGGIDTDLFRPTSLKEARTRVGIEGDGPIIGFSSLDSHLDMLPVLEATRRLGAKFPDLRLLVTGTVGPSLMSAIQDCAVGDKVISPGRVPYESLPIYLSCCDVCVLPYPDTVYNRGRWPNKVLDYMAVGRPIVGNPTGDCARLLQDSHRRVGVACQYDAASFAGAIEHLLLHPEESKKIGQNGRRMAEAEFAWEHVVERLESAYRQHLSDGVFG